MLLIFTSTVDTMTGRNKGLVVLQRWNEKYIFVGIYHHASLSLHTGTPICVTWYPFIIHNFFTADCSLYSIGSLRSNVTASFKFKSYKPCRCNISYQNTLNCSLQCTSSFAYCRSHVIGFAGMSDDRLLDIWSQSFLGWISKYNNIYWCTNHGNSINISVRVSNKLP